MFNIFFKTSFRSLARNKNYTVINIAGLAVGIAVCIIIFVIIQFQTSFDTFHLNKDRIYRVLTEYHHADAVNPAYGKDVPFPAPAGLKTEFPQIEQVAPIFASHDDKLLIPDDNGTTIKAFKEDKGVFFTEPSFFKIFDYPLLTGSDRLSHSVEGVRRNLNSVVLADNSTAAAVKTFTPVFHREYPV